VSAFGVVLVLLGLFVIGPILLFFTGAIWSAILGFLLTEEAEAEHPLPT
jgi:hypothetical protein